MPALRRRRGTGLAESLVALTLASVVMAAASRGLAQHLRQHRDREAQTQADEVVREVVDVLRAELAHADGGPRVLGDTAVDLASMRAFASACDLTGVRLVIPSSVEWWSPPRTGDSAAVMDTLTGTEWRVAVAATASQRASARCPAGGTRLTLAMPPPSSVPAAFFPVRVWRVVRYMAYRASDGNWWLGERACVPGCGSAQPIAGPLLAPGQGGLRLSLVLRSDGRPVALDVSVRARAGGRTSSLSARLPLTSIR